MAKTFAQYLIDKTLPPDMAITRQVDKSYLNELLGEVARRYPDRYDATVSALKKLGDTFSTMEPVTMGLREIEVPNREKRDAIIRKYTALVKKDRGDGDKVIGHTLRTCRWTLRRMISTGRRTMHPSWSGLPLRVTRPSS